MGHRSRETASGSDYLSYLLRLWQESERALEGREEPVWRASLTSPATGERVGFANLEELMAYLQERMANAPDSEEAQDRSIGSSERRGWSIEK